MSARKSRFRQFLILCAAVGLLFMFALAPEPLVCRVEASHLLTEFCFRADVTVSKANAGDLDDYPLAIRLNLNQLIAQGRAGENGWDFVTTDAGLIQATPMAQDTATAAETTLWTVADIVGGSPGTTPLKLFTGHAEFQRDQGMYFHTASGASSVTVPNHADFQITDDLLVIVRANTLTPDQTGNLLDRHNGNNGYALELSSTGDGKILARTGVFEVAAALVAAPIEQQFVGFDAVLYHGVGATVVRHQHIVVTQART